MKPQTFIFGATEQEKRAYLRAMLDGHTPDMPRHYTVTVTITGATSEECERTIAVITAALAKEASK